MILGLASGICIIAFSPTFTDRELVMHSFFLTNQENIEIIENWNSLLGKKEYAELSATLNCPANLFPKVKKISAGEIQKVFSVTNPNGFLVEVNVTDNSILDDLQKAIVYGLENTEYVKLRLDSRRASLDELIDKTAAEIIKLDSTKKLLKIS